MFRDVVSFLTQTLWSKNGIMAMKWLREQVTAFSGALYHWAKNCLFEIFRSSRKAWSAPGPHGLTQGPEKHSWRLHLQPRSRKIQRRPVSPPLPLLESKHRQKALKNKPAAMSCEVWRETALALQWAPGWSHGLPGLSWNMCIHESLATFLRG